MFTATCPLFLQPLVTFANICFQSEFRKKLKVEDFIMLALVGLWGNKGKRRKNHLVALTGQS